MYMYIEQKLHKQNKQDFTKLLKTKLCFINFFNLTGMNVLKSSVRCRRTFQKKYIADFRWSWAILFVSKTDLITHWKTPFLQQHTIAPESYSPILRSYINKPNWNKQNLTMTFSACYFLSCKCDTIKWIFPRLVVSVGVYWNLKNIWSTNSTRHIRRKI